MELSNKTIEKIVKFKIQDCFLPVLIDNFLMLTDCFVPVLTDYFLPVLTDCVLPVLTDCFLSVLTVMFHSIFRVAFVILNYMFDADAIKCLMRYSQRKAMKTY